MNIYEQLIEKEFTPFTFENFYFNVITKEGDWGPEEEALHPRASAGTPGGKGGQFVRKIEGTHGYFLHRAGKNARIFPSVIAAALEYAAEKASRTDKWAEKVGIYRREYEGLIERKRLPYVPVRTNEIEKVEEEITKHLPFGEVDLGVANVKVREIMNAAEIRMNRGLPGALGTIRKGRVKSTHESGIRGTDSATTRRFCESRFLDLPKKYPDRIRPIYGYLSDKESSPLSSYGEYCFVFKDHVKTRATVTGNDSWFSRHEWRSSPYVAYYGSTVANPSIVSFIRKPDRVLAMAGDGGIPVREFFNIERKLRTKEDRVFRTLSSMESKLDEDNRLLYNKITEILSEGLPGKKKINPPTHILYMELGEQWLDLNTLSGELENYPKIREDALNLFKQYKKIQAYKNIAAEFSSKRGNLVRNIKVNTKSEEFVNTAFLYERAINNLAKNRRKHDELPREMFDGNWGHRAMKYFDAHNILKRKKEEMQNMAAIQRKIVQDAIDDIRNIGRAVPNVEFLQYSQSHDSMYIETQIQHGVRLKDVDRIVQKNVYVVQETVLMALEAEKRGIPFKFKFRNNKGVPKEISIRNYINLLHAKFELERKEKYLTDVTKILGKRMSEGEIASGHYHNAAKKLKRIRKARLRLEHNYITKEPGLNTTKYMEASLLYHQVKDAGGIEGVKKMYDDTQAILKKHRNNIPESVYGTTNSSTYQFYNHMKGRGLVE